MKESYFGSHKGFTLAEVLVTLGIIGVVSAMTVPTLMQNYQRQSYVTQLHKVYNEFSQAAERYKNDNNYLNLSESRVRGNADELKRFFNSYFKVVKDCGTRYTPCFASEYRSLSGTTNKISNGQCNVVVVLASGAAICADSATMQDVDINGTKGPNIYGRDYFSFQIDRNGQVFDKFYAANGNAAKFDVNHPDNGLFGKIIADGWQMTY